MKLKCENCAELTKSQKPSFLEWTVSPTHVLMLSLLGGGAMFFFLGRC
jgi:hypothetical protein